MRHMKMDLEFIYYIRGVDPAALRLTVMNPSHQPFDLTLPTTSPPLAR